MESFGEWPRARGIGWHEYEDLDVGRAVPALVIGTERADGGERVLAHIAYEAVACLRSDPAASNLVLLRSLRPFLKLLNEGMILEPAAQQGLFAELLFLGKLLDFAMRAVPALSAERVLRVWTGFQTALRDFASTQVAIEVKSSARSTRVHRISPMEQLLRAEDEQDRHLVLCSVGLRRDASAAVTLADLVVRTMNRLPESLRGEFSRKVGEYHGVGFDLGALDRYRREPGYSTTQPMRLYGVGDTTELLRMSDFILGRPPSTVSRVAYDLDVTSWRPLEPESESSVLMQLLQP